MQRNVVEPQIPIFEGKYKEILTSINNNIMAGVILFIGLLLVVILLGQIKNPVLLSAFIQIPIIVFSLIVLSPNKILRSKMIPFWILPSIISELSIIHVIYLPYSIVNYSMQKLTSELIGILLCFEVLFMLIYSIKWTRDFYRINYKVGDRNNISSTVAELFCIWGCFTQIFVFVSNFLSIFIRYNVNSASIHLLEVISKFISTNTFFAYLPMVFIFLGIILYVSLQFQIHQFNPIKFDQILPLNDKVLFFYKGIFIGIKIPIWIIILIIGFLRHFIFLFIISIYDFIKYFIARFVFIFLSVILPFSLFFISPLLIYLSLKFAYNDNLEVYSIFSYISFLKTHGLLLLSLCFYSLGVALLTIRYRGESIDNIFSSITLILSSEGKKALISLGNNTYSTFGILIIIIPIIMLLPPIGPIINVYSVLYVFIVLVLLTYELYTKNNLKGK